MCITWLDDWAHNYETTLRVRRLGHIMSRPILVLTSLVHWDYPTLKLFSWDNLQLQWVSRLLEEILFVHLHSSTPFPAPVLSLQCWLTRIIVNCRIFMWWSFPLHSCSCSCFPTFTDTPWQPTWNIEISLYQCSHSRKLSYTTIMLCSAVKE